jgi:hypothetical protein
MDGTGEWAGIENMSDAQGGCVVDRSTKDLGALLTGPAPPAQSSSQSDTWKGTRGARVSWFVDQLCEHRKLVAAHWRHGNVRSF